MSRGRTIIISVLLAGLAIGFLILAARVGEPAYRGKSLSYWLERRAQDGGVWGDTEAKTALRQMGTNALPHLLAMLQAKDSALKRLLIRLQKRQSLIRVRFKKVEATRNLAAGGIAAIGPSASPLIPALTNLLNDADVAVVALFSLRGIGAEAGRPLIASLDHTNPAVRLWGVQFLAGIHGTDREAICAALIRATKDPDWNVRRQAYQAVTRTTCDATGVLRAVINGMCDTDARVRVYCIGNVGGFGTNAGPAIPGLLAALDDRGTYRVAAQSLREIAPDVGMWAHLENLANTNGWKRLEAAICLGELGRDAADAVPVLLKGLADSDDVKRACAQALLSIDPELAKSAGVAYSSPARRQARVTPP